MTFCAICTDDIAGTHRLEPLGRNGARVAVCRDCATVPPAVRLGPERTYQVNERESAAYRDAKAPPTGNPRGLAPQLRQSHRERTPGMILVRVSHMVDGKPIDFRDADASLRGKPWFHERRYLGSDGKSYVYERPDPKVAAAARHVAVDPLAAIAKHRRSR